MNDDTNFISAPRCEIEGVISNGATHTCALREAVGSGVPMDVHDAFLWISDSDWTEKIARVVVFYGVGRSTGAPQYSSRERSGAARKIRHQETRDCEVTYYHVGQGRLGLRRSI